MNGFEVEGKVEILEKRNRAPFFGKYSRKKELY
jgi:hypothetical protein